MACIAAIVTGQFKLSATASPRDRFMIGGGVKAACATLTAAGVTHLVDGHRCMFQIIQSPKTSSALLLPLAATVDDAAVDCQWSAVLAAER